MKSFLNMQTLRVWSLDIAFRIIESHEFIALQKRPTLPRSPLETLDERHCNRVIIMAKPLFHALGLGAIG